MPMGFIGAIHQVCEGIDFDSLELSYRKIIIGFRFAFPATAKQKNQGKEYKWPDDLQVIEF
jgi:hypothetical protein